MKSGIQSTHNGWKCKCGVHRNSTNEVWDDCLCSSAYTEKEIKEINEKYWSDFWY